MGAVEAVQVTGMLAHLELVERPVLFAVLLARVDPVDVPELDISWLVTLVWGFLPLLFTRLEVLLMMRMQLWLYVLLPDAIVACLKALDLNYLELLTMITSCSELIEKKNFMLILSFNLENKKIKGRRLSVLK